MEEAVRCAQKAVKLNPKWKKFIREVEKKVRVEHQKQYAEIPLEVCKSKPDPLKPEKQSEIDPMALALVQESGTTLDGKSELSGSSLIIGYIGIATRELDGLGPQRIIDPDTKEEWIIERKGSEIITHSYKEPRRKPETPFISSFRVAGIGGSVDFKSKEYRLFKALQKTAESRRYSRKLGVSTPSEALEEYLQKESEDNSQESYKRKRSRGR